jgi:hypothetical protein
MGSSEAICHNKNNRTFSPTRWDCTFIPQTDLHISEEVEPQYGGSYTKAYAKKDSSFNDLSFSMRKSSPLNRQ